MIDINKILELVDNGKDVFIAREDKPMIAVVSMAQYEDLKKNQNFDQKSLFNNVIVNNDRVIADNDDYATRVKSSIMDY